MKNPGQARAPYLQYTFTLILPILLFALACLLKKVYGPYYLGYNSDPEYAYLLNSLNLINGLPPRHIDHPGTTVQLLGALAILGRWLVGWATGNTLGITEFVLRNPEECLDAINFLFNLLILCSLVFTTSCIYLATRSLVPVIVYQVSVLIPFQVKLSLLRASPEPLLVFCVILLSGLLIKFQHRKIAGKDCRYLVLGIGVLMGFGIVTKVTFVPLLLFLFVFTTTREKFAALIACIAATVVLLAPILNKFRRLYDWFSAIALHKGRYGEGEVGLPAVSELWSNFITLVQSEPFLLVSLTCCITALILFISFKDRSMGGKRELVICLAIILLQYLITVKHPAVHYLVPAITLTATINYWVYLRLKEWSDEFGKGFLRGAMFAVLAVGILHGAVATNAWAVEQEAYCKCEIERQQWVNAMPNGILVNYYRGSSMEFALSFGDSFAGYAYNRDLYSMYPGSVFYDPGSGCFKCFAGTIDGSFIREALKSYRIVIAGMPLDEHTRKHLELRPLQETPKVATYLVSGTR